MTITRLLVSLNIAFSVGSIIGSICGIAQAYFANTSGLFPTWIFALALIAWIFALTLIVINLLSAIKNN